MKPLNPGHATSHPECAHSRPRPLLQNHWTVGAGLPAKKLTPYLLGSMLLLALPATASDGLVIPQAQQQPTRQVTPLPSSVSIQPLPDARDNKPDKAQPPSRPIEPTAQPASPPEHTLSTPQTAPTRKSTRTRHARPAKGSELDLALQRANADFQARRYTQTLAALAPLEANIFAKRHVDAARLQGWAAWHTGDFALALRWFTRAANWTNQDEDKANVVRADLALHHYPAALDMLTRLPKDDTWRELRIQTHQAYALHLFKAEDYANAIIQLGLLEK